MNNYATYFFFDCVLILARMFWFDFERERLMFFMLG